jgi:hypothetical protein
MDDDTGVLAGRLTPSCRQRSGQVTTITVNSVEVNSLQVFVSAHAQCSKDGWPPRFELSSTPTGIGSSIRVKCCSCGAVDNISDLDSW